MAISSLRDQTEPAVFALISPWWRRNFWSSIEGSRYIWLHNKQNWKINKFFNEDLLKKSTLFPDWNASVVTLIFTLELLHVMCDMHSWSFIKHLSMEKEEFIVYIVRKNRLPDSMFFLKDFIAEERLPRRTLPN